MIGRKPDLVCIGAQKAATSWFNRVMSARDDCWSPPFKELHFFDYKFTPENRGWIRTHVVKGVEAAEARHRKNQEEPDKAYLRYLDSILEPPLFNGTWYKQLYARAPDRMICLDTTPEYSCISEEGVEFVAKFLREARFIYILRDPVDRALSQIRMHIRRKKKENPTTKGQWLRIARLDVLDNRGDYATYVPRWQKHFDERRLLFLPYRDISTDPRAVMRRVEAFANLQKEDPWGLDQPANISQKLEIPDYVVAELEQRLQPQRDFLHSHFGADFAART